MRVIYVLLHLHHPLSYIAASALRLELDAILESNTSSFDIQLHKFLQTTDLEQLPRREITSCADNSLVLEPLEGLLDGNVCRRQARERKYHQSESQRLSFGRRDQRSCSVFNL